MTHVAYNDIERELVGLPTMAGAKKEASHAYIAAINEATAIGNLKLAAELRECYNMICEASSRALNAVCDLQD